MKIYKAWCYDKNQDKQIDDVYLGVMEYPNDYPVLSGEDVDRMAEPYGLKAKDIHFTFGDDMYDWKQGLIINEDNFIWTIIEELGETNVIKGNKKLYHIQNINRMGNGEPYDIFVWAENTPIEEEIIDLYRKEFSELLTKDEEKRCEDMAQESEVYRVYAEELDKEESK